MMDLQICRSCFQAWASWRNLALKLWIWLILTKTTEHSRPEQVIKEASTEQKEGRPPGSLTGHLGKIKTPRSTNTVMLHVSSSLNYLEHSCKKGKKNTDLWVTTISFLEVTGETHGWPPRDYHSQKLAGIWGMYRYNTFVSLRKKWVRYEFITKTEIWESLYLVSFCSWQIILPGPS